MVAKLPPLNIKSLGDADQEDIELKERPKCQHRFIYRKATEVGCIKCHMGFFIGGNDILKDGHLYLGGKLVI